MAFVKNRMRTESLCRYPKAVRGPILWWTISRLRYGRCEMRQQPVGLGVAFYVPEILPRIEQLSLLKIIATVADDR